MDYIPFVHSAMSGEIENTQSGYMYVSGLGSKTSCTEFEFLTGNTMAFLPEGCTPYQDYVNDRRDFGYTMPAVAKKAGYSTVALHPYYGFGYHRDKVYPLLRFDQMYFIEDFKDPEYVRDYVSDRTLFNRIIDEYEKKGDKPWFSMNVTMQNHSYYSDNADEVIALKKNHLAVGDNYSLKDGVITVEGSGDDSLETYLSLEAITDQDLKDLFDYFDRQDEKTIVVFFGDHQPAKAVTDPIQKFEGLSPETYYKVPYIIHANYDIDEEQSEETICPAFLGSKVWKLAGLPETPFMQVIEEAAKNYEAIKAAATVMRDGADSEQAASAINRYRQYEYYNILD